MRHFLTANCSDRWCERLYELSVEKARQLITHKVARHRQAVWIQEFLVCQVLKGDVEIKDRHLLDADPRKTSRQGVSCCLNHCVIPYKCALLDRCNVLMVHGTHWILSNKS